MEELKIREQDTLKSQQIFVEKTQVLKDKEKLCTQHQNLLATIEQACKYIPELGITDDAEASAKVRKLVFAVCASKEKVKKVTFDLMMQITKLKLNLQQNTPREVQEQRNATIKESMAQLNVIL